MKKIVFALFVIVLLFASCTASKPYSARVQSVDGAGVDVVIYGVFEGYEVLGITFKNAHEIIVLRNQATGKLAGATTSYIVSTGKVTYSVPRPSVVMED